MSPAELLFGNTLEAHTNPYDRPSSCLSHLLSQLEPCVHGMPPPTQDAWSNFGDVLFMEEEVLQCHIIHSYSDDSVCITVFNSVGDMAGSLHTPMKGYQHITRPSLQPLMCSECLGPYCCNSNVITGHLEFYFCGKKAENHIAVSPTFREYGDSPPLTPYSPSSPKSERILLTTKPPKVSCNEVQHLRHSSGPSLCLLVPAQSLECSSCRRSDTNAKDHTDE